MRNNLRASGLIGVTDDGVGYGNISERTAGISFLISGASTGHIEMAAAEHFCLVENCNIDTNEVTCSGPVKASSESMTHYAFYKANPEIHSVIHVHHHSLWTQWLNKLPTTANAAEYGTPAMAREISRLVHSAQGLILTAGHRDGIFSYGSSIQSAFIPLQKIVSEL